jgi:hypothetical protein
MGWRPDRLLRALLHWTALTTIIFWLPLVRSVFDGASYAWALGGALGGRGLQGDLWLPALGVTFALATLWLGWRGARPPFRWLLLGWHLLLGAGATYLAVKHGDQFTFRGDTLGIDVSLAVIGPLLFGGFALAAVLWVVRDLISGRRPAAPPWTLANRYLLGGLVALLPLQFVLFRFGEPNGRTDEIGVLVTIVQWLLLGLALRPWDVGGAEEPGPRPVTESG